MCIDDISLICCSLAILFVSWESVSPLLPLILQSSTRKGDIEKSFNNWSNREAIEKREEYSTDSAGGAMEDVSLDVGGQQNCSSLHLSSKCDLILSDKALFGALHCVHLTNFVVTSISNVRNTAMQFSAL